MPKKTDINRDIIKRDGAERRREDIEQHGKPTAFRTTKTKNKKAYTRKEKHKVDLCEDDIRKMVYESVRMIAESEVSDMVEQNFDDEVSQICQLINEYLSQFGIKAKFNKRYDFSGYYADCVAVYQNRSVRRDGCMRFSVNKAAIMSWLEDEDDFITYDDVIDQIRVSLWHECGHGLIDWIKQQRRLDTQRGTGIFKGKKLKAVRWLLGFDEEDLVEEFAEQMVFHDTHSDLVEFINEYMK